MSVTNIKVRTEGGHKNTDDGNPFEVNHGLGVITIKIVNSDENDKFVSHFQIKMTSFVV